MTLITTFRTLPRILLLEAGFVTVAILALISPIEFITQTPLPSLGWMSASDVIALCAVVGFWLALVCHAALDGWRYLTKRQNHDRREVYSQVLLLFRVVEIAGAIAPVLWIGLFVTAGTLPTITDIIIIYTAAIALCLSAITVFLHIGWLAWSGDSSQSEGSTEAQ